MIVPGILMNIKMFSEKKKRKKNAVGKLLSQFILFLSSVRYYYEVAKYTPN